MRIFAEIAVVPAVLFALLLGALPTSATAQPFPERPLKILVGGAPGSVPDAMIRPIAEQLSVSLGQPVVVENKPGAAGIVAMQALTRAAPDGYTLSIGHWSTHVVNGAVYQLSYDLRKDFEPVAMIATNPQLIVTKTTVPATNLTELVTWVKANQERVSVGTAGVGSASHVGGIYFQNIIGAKLLFVPYRGAAPALQDLMAGQIDLILDQAANSLPWVRSGKIRAYAVTAKARVAAAPDIPTVDEAGLPGLYIAVWHAIWVPKGTPKEIVARLNAAVVETLADPSVRQRLADLGQEIPAREQQTPEALGAYHDAEIAKWWPLIKAAGIKAE